MIGSDGEHFGRVGICFEVDNGDGIGESVDDDVVSDSVFADRTVNLHINTYRNTKQLGME
jgi:hypothetical protein